MESFLLLINQYDSTSPLAILRTPTYPSSESPDSCSKWNDTPWSLAPSFEPKQTKTHGLQTLLHPSISQPRKFSCQKIPLRFWIISTLIWIVPCFFDVPKKRIGSRNVWVQCWINKPIMHGFFANDQNDDTIWTKRIITIFSFISNLRFRHPSWKNSLAEGRWTANAASNLHQPTTLPREHVSKNADANIGTLNVRCYSAERNSYISSSTCLCRVSSLEVRQCRLFGKLWFQQKCKTNSGKEERQKNDSIRRSWSIWNGKHENRTMLAKKWNAPVQITGSTTLNPSVTCLSHFLQKTSNLNAKKTRPDFPISLQIFMPRSVKKLSYWDSGIRELVSEHLEQNLWEEEFPSMVVGNGQAPRSIAEPILVRVAILFWCSNFIPSQLPILCRLPVGRIVQRVEEVILIWPGLRQETTTGVSAQHSLMTDSINRCDTSNTLCQQKVGFLNFWICTLKGRPSLDTFTPGQKSISRQCRLSGVTKQWWKAGVRQQFFYKALLRQCKCCFLEPYKMFSCILPQNFLSNRRKASWPTLKNGPSATSVSSHLATRNRGPTKLKAEKTSSFLGHHHTAHWWRFLDCSSIEARERSFQSPVTSRWTLKSYSYSFQSPTYARLLLGCGWSPGCTH